MPDSVVQSLVAERDIERSRRLYTEQVRDRLNLLYKVAQERLHRAKLRCPEADAEGPYRCRVCSPSSP